MRWPIGCQCLLSEAAGLFTTEHPDEAFWRRSGRLVLRLGGVFDRDGYAVGIVRCSFDADCLGVFFTSETAPAARLVVG